MNDDKIQRCEKVMPAYRKEGWTTKFVEKFIPVFLPESKKYIRMRETASIKRKRPNWWDESTQYESGNCLFKKLSLNSYLNN
jgi:hypothetical protein